MLRRFGVIAAVALTLVVPVVSRAQDPPADSVRATPPPATQTPPAQTAPPAQEPAKPAPKIEKVERPEGPPEELKRLERLVGSWNAKTQTFESAMGAESKYAGKTTFKWQFAGMHLDGIHEYQVAGENTFGRSTWSWDPDRQQYQIIWINRTSPVAFVYYGTFAGDNTLVLFSTFMMQGKAITQKMTYQFSDSDNYTMFVENDMSGEMKRWTEETGSRVKATGKAAPAKKPATTTKKTG